MKKVGRETLDGRRDCSCSIYRAKMFGKQINPVGSVRLRRTTGTCERRETKK
jgi:hypothetical protein